MLVHVPKKKVSKFQSIKQTTMYVLYSVPRSCIGMIVIPLQSIKTNYKHSLVGVNFSFQLEAHKLQSAIESSPGKD